jgi:hypothetical protein
MMTLDFSDPIGSHPIVNVILILFREKDYQLLNECCIGLKNQSFPCYVTVVYDPLTTKEERDFVLQFHFDEYIESPKEMSTFPALRHKWAYDRSNYRYVAFQQGDDQPYLCRIEEQYNAITTSKKEIGICFGGFHYELNKQLDHCVPDYFKYIKQHLFNVGYPSFWLLDKSKIKQLPEIKGFEAPNEWEWDLFMLIEILKQTNGLVIDQSLGIYNQHKQNSTNTHCSKQSQTDNYSQLCHFFTTQCKAIKDIYEIKADGTRNDNK